jgi:hypothetical protein
VDRGDSKVPIGLQLRDIDSTDAMCLDGVNVDDEAILRIVSETSVPIMLCEVERDGAK